MEVLIYGINLSIEPILMLLKAWFLSKRFNLPVINPFSVTLFLELPLFLLKEIIAPQVTIDGGLMNPHFQYVVFISSIDSAIALAVFLSVLEMMMHNKKRLVYWAGLFKFSIAPAGLKKGATGLLVIAIGIFVIMASYKFGVLNWILDPRTGYQNYRAGLGLLYGLCLSFLAVSFVIFVYGETSFRKIVAISGFFVVLVYFLGSKGFIIQFGLFTISLISLKFPDRVRSFAVFALPLFLAAVLYNLASAIKDLDLTSFIEYFDYYKNSTRFVEDYFTGEVELYGGQISLSQFWELVPRLVYPDKPVVYGVLLLVEHYFPGAAALGSTPAFGGPIIAFADFGFLGVCVGSFFHFEDYFLAFAAAFFFGERGDLFRFDSRRISTFVLLFAPAYASFFPFPSNVGLFLMIFTILSITSRTVLRRRKHDSQIGSERSV